MTHIGHRCTWQGPGQAQGKGRVILELCGHEYMNLLYGTCCHEYMNLWYGTCGHEYMNINHELVVTNLFSFWPKCGTTAPKHLAPCYFNVAPKPWAPRAKHIAMASGICGRGSLLCSVILLSYVRPHAHGHSLLDPQPRTTSPPHGRSASTARSDPGGVGLLLGSHKDTDDVCALPDLADEPG
jgi:hypothetical protein